jgi:predicted nucleic acid-binding protein
MIFVDTSVLIAALRGHSSAPVLRLNALEAQGVPYAIPVLCCQEVLQGAANEREWALLSSNLSTQRLIVPAQPLAVHWEAARIFFECRRRGLTVRSSVDCLIAAIALEAGAELLHDDDDFERVAKVRPLRLLRG